MCIDMHEKPGSAYQSRGKARVPPPCPSSLSSPSPPVVHIHVEPFAHRAPIQLCEKHSAFSEGGYLATPLQRDITSSIHQPQLQGLQPQQTARRSQLVLLVLFILLVFLVLLVLAASLPRTFWTSGGSCLRIGRLIALDLLRRILHWNRHTEEDDSERLA